MLPQHLKMIARVAQIKTHEYLQKDFRISKAMPPYY